MRRAILAALLVLVSCKGETAAPDAGPSKPPTLQVVAVGLPLARGLERATRIGFRAAGGFASIILNHPVGSQADVCPLATLDAALPPAASCITGIGRGVRETVSRSGGLGGIAIVSHDDAAIADVRLEFPEGGRDVSFRFARLAAQAGASVCKDNGCNPIFEIMPVQGGPFTARAAWAGGAARFELQSGRVIARSFTATNIPYRIPADDQGPSPLQIATELSAPAEYALAFINTSSAELSDIVIEATWP